MAYSITPTLVNELALYLCGWISVNDICIFDNVCGTYKVQQNSELFQACGLFHKEEVYYLLTKENATREALDLCIQLSEAFWHSLCVVAPYHVCPKERELTNEVAEKISSSCKVVIVGAYDAEGYIFWEKRNNNTDHLT